MYEIGLQFNLSEAQPAPLSWITRRVTISNGVKFIFRHGRVAALTMLEPRGRASRRIAWRADRDRGNEEREEKTLRNRACFAFLPFTRHRSRSIRSRESAPPIDPRRPRSLIHSFSTSILRAISTITETQRFSTRSRYFSFSFSPFLFSTYRFFSSVRRESKEQTIQDTKCRVYGKNFRSMMKLNRFLCSRFFANRPRGE